MHLEKLHDIGLLPVGTLKPGKSLLVVTQSQVRIDEGCCRNVTGLLAPF